MRLFALLLVIVCQSLRAGVDATVVVLPKGWDHKSPLPVAIWLHGYGANPSRIRDDAFYQATADALKIAVVGVPATREVETNAFVWAEVPAFDFDQVQKALREAERRSGATFSEKALFGFSQGAVVAAELAARYPEIFAGAIVLSPGADIFPTSIGGAEGNRRQRYFISTGAEEAAGNLQFARAYRKILSALGSTVIYREVLGMKQHDRPPDWPERFQEWTAMILQPKKDPNPTPARTSR